MLPLRAAYLTRPIALFFPLFFNSFVFVHRHQVVAIHSWFPLTFNTLMAVIPILGFLSTTDVGRGLGEAEEEEGWFNRLDRWDLDRLEEEEGA